MRDKKKLERWIKDLLCEEYPQLDWNFGSIVDDIVEAVYNWLEEEGE